MSHAKIIVVLSVFLAACAGSPQPEIPMMDIKSEQDTGRATSSLLAKVDIEEEVQNWERAASLLERALRIEPRNAQLWHRLAQVRLQQGQYYLAASLAQKSSALAGDDIQLQEKNTRLQKQARALAREG
ncbi:MAG: tetratricopeptide repeat protein [Gammaproteobacteria bacterium]|nr:tetratricopeptide repeat protein [Gammaproteobacteria bacterium]